MKLLIDIPENKNPTLCNPYCQFLKNLPDSSNTVICDLFYIKLESNWDKIYEQFKRCKPCISNTNAVNQMANNISDISDILKTTSNILNMEWNNECTSIV